MIADGMSVVRFEDRSFVGDCAIDQSCSLVTRALRVKLRVYFMSSVLFVQSEEKSYQVYLGMFRLLRAFHRSSDLHSGYSIVGFLDDARSPNYLKTAFVSPRARQLQI